MARPAPRCGRSLFPMGTPASVESVPVAALPVWNLIVRSGAVLIRVRVPRMTFSWFPSVAIQGGNELQIGKWRLLLAHDPILALVDKALCVSRAGLCDGWLTVAERLERGNLRVSALAGWHIVVLALLTVVPIVIIGAIIMIAIRVSRSMRASGEERIAQRTAELLGSQDGLGN